MDASSQHDYTNLNDDGGDFIPSCDENLKPYVGKKFATEDEGIDFYQKYGAMCGFDIRLGTVKKSKCGVTLLRYVFYNKEGHKYVPRTESEDGACCSSEKKRQCVSKRFDCKAKMYMKYCGLEGYVVCVFVERHTHSLLSESFEFLLKANRNLGVGHQKFLADCRKANIGSSKAYRLMSVMMGGYSQIGCTLLDFKNYSRDLKAHVIGVDAQIVIDDLCKRSESCSDFSFEYDVNEDDELTRLFWSDPTLKRNYSMFGDAVSFDATYSTNRYNMIFTPFTGKDNHGRCVTFGAGLLSAEDVDSYVWLFENFKEKMGESPKLIVTDQDPAMKIVVDRVFPGTRHRLCMWHIMMKVKDKLPVDLKNDESFFKGLHKIVWAESIEPETFDKEWELLMKAYDLVDHNWFTMMFEIRKFWIPAFLKDCPMSGLFKTTSLSESENSFFRRYMNHRANLVEFFMHFDRALEYQRHAQGKMNGEDELWRPKLVTRLAIEKHATSFYTKSCFYKVQDEISAGTFVCVTHDKNEYENTIEYEVNDCVYGVCNVVFDKVQKTLCCSCKKFERVGYMCCHMFFQLKEMKVDLIHDKYIVRRWAKFAFLKELGIGDGGSGQQHCEIDELKAISSKMVTEFYCCRGIAEGNKELKLSILNCITVHKEKMLADVPSKSTRCSKKQSFDNYFETAVPSEVSVFPPANVKTKGSGRRTKSKKEQVIEASKKPLRNCRKCGEMVHHDSRNCPLNNRS